MSHAIRIAAPAAEAREGVTRVSAVVDGIPIWFESPDLPLTPSAEAFASAFLVPSLAQRRRLVSEGPLDSVWLANMPRLIEIFSGWWRYSRLLPEAAAGAAPASPPDPSRARGRALFFSGGVDSFHALLHAPEPIDRLIFVEGLDMPLDDTARVAATLAGIREVAAERGIGVVRVRTNLRDHPLVGKTPWERANGGALAAIGHLLADSVREVVIASSVAVAWNLTWGSHWETDPLFSSSRLALREAGHELRRLEKVRQIAGDALVQKHLRVCWVNLAPTGNCSKCGKCVLTRLMLADSGMLDRFSGLAGSATLVRDLDALPHDSHRASLNDLVTLGKFAPELREAARALLARSNRVRRFPVRQRRALVRTLLRWTGALRRT
ncbi:MAG: hypothetical protein ABIS67_12645 [Candidatus Eisenbacteria bacterium]